MGDYIDEIAPTQLEFLSVHHYNDCDSAALSELADYLADVKSEIDLVRADLPVLVTEWNIGLGSQCGADLFATDQSAAYAAAGLSIMADPAAGVAGSWYYSGVPPMGPFSADESDFGMTASRLSWSLSFHGRLTGSTFVETTLCDEDGLDCLSPLTAASDGRTLTATAAVNGGEIGVVLTNYSDQTQVVNVDAARSGSWTLTRSPAGVHDVDTEEAEPGRFVPTAAAMAELMARETTESPPVADEVVQIELAAWESVWLQMVP